MALAYLLAAALAFEVGRDALRKLGDFQGYVAVGNHTLAGTDIYANPRLNTWPPFFSVAAVPIAAAANAARKLTHLVWLLGAVWCVWVALDLLGRMAHGRKLDLRGLGPGRWRDRGAQAPPLLRPGRIALAHASALVPLLLSLRYLLDNLANLQINTYLLAACVGGVYLWSAGRALAGGALVGLAASLKVYPLVLVAYFAAKREWRFAGGALCCVVVCGLIPFAVWGPELAGEYYATWFETTVGADPYWGHKNQGYLATATRFLSPVDAGGEQLGAFAVNFVSLSAKRAGLVAYGLVALIGLAVLHVFRRPLSRPLPPRDQLEVAVAFALCALLSPIAWKAYFVFLLPVVYQLYRYVHGDLRGVAAGAAGANPQVLATAFYGAWGLTVASSELFLGRVGSDLAEAYGAYALGTVGLCATAVWLRAKAWH